MLTAQVSELTKKVADQSTFTEKCSVTVNSASVVRRYLNEMNEAVESMNLIMDESLSKFDELGTTIGECKIFDV